MQIPTERLGLTLTDHKKQNGGNTTNNIKRDIKRLDEIAWYLKRKNFSKAFNLLNLKADCYYKPTEEIERQICDNINYDIVSGTQQAYEFCRHLKLDLELVLEQIGD